MYRELLKKAKIKVETKKIFYICAIVFPFVSILLITLSFQIPKASFWVRLPIPFFIMVLGILYLYVFGWPSADVLSEDWQEKEIEKEMIKRYRQEKNQLPPLEELSERDFLELKELKQLKKKQDWDEEYV